MLIVIGVKSCIASLIILTGDRVECCEPTRFHVHKSNVTQSFFLLLALTPLKVEHGSIFFLFPFFIHHTSPNSPAALLEVQINPIELEEYTLQVLASNEV